MSGQPDYTTNVNIVNSVITVTGSVTVSGTVSISGPVTVTGTVSISGTVSVSGTVAISGTVTVTGSVTVSGTVSISGTVTVSGSVTVSGTVSISGTVTVSGTVAISGTVTVSGSVTVSGTVAISGTVTISGSVSVTGTVTISGSVTITSGTINIQTSGSDNIIIDLLNQDAYTERRSTLSNQGTTASWYSRTGANRTGKFFPRGAVGHIEAVTIHCRDNAAAGGTITVYLSPFMGAGPLQQATITVPAGGGADDRNATFDVFWKYNSLFIWWVSSVSDVEHAYDTGGDPDDWSSSDSGLSWTKTEARPWATAVYKGQTVGDVSVAGTVTVVELPSTGSSTTSGSTSCADGSPTTLETKYGMGTLLEATVIFDTAVAPTAVIVYQLGFIIDGVNCGWWDSRQVTQSVTATSGRGAIGEFYQSATQTILIVRIPLKYRYSIAIRALQNTGGAVDAAGELVLNEAQ